MGELTPDQLRKVCLPEEVASALGNESAQIFAKNVWVGVGQDRLTHALEYGLSELKSRQNIFISGLSTATSLDAVKDYVEKFISEHSGDFPEPRDWCYVYNFEESHRPVPVPLKRGKGKALQRALPKLGDNIVDKLNNFFKGTEAKMEQDQITAPLEMKWVSKVKDLQESAFEDGIYVMAGGEIWSAGFQIAPIDPAWKAKEEAEDRPADLNSIRAMPEGQIQNALVLQAQLNSFPKEQYEQIVSKMAYWQNQARELLEWLRGKREEVKEKVEAFRANKAKEIIEDEFRAFRGRVKESRTRVFMNFLDALEAYSVENFEKLRSWQDVSEQNLAERKGPVEDPLVPFKVNLFLDNSETEGPPVVVESNPTHENLVGSIKSSVSMGGRGLMMATTDHTMVKAGSLARANGGYLILNIRDVLTNPGAYQALKQAVKNEVLQVAELMSVLGYGSSSQLQPKPIPMRAKLVLVGSDFIWHRLSQVDDEFSSVFGVKAQINPYLERNETEIASCAKWVRDYAAENTMPDFADDAIGKLVEHSSRMSGRSDKLSADFGAMLSVVHEAAHLARKDESEKVTGDHVKRALDNKFYRLNLVYERMQERIQDGTFIFDFEGKKVGEAYGLVVYSLSDISFGKPSRVSAQVYPSAKLEFTSIDKEAELAGQTTVKAHKTIEAFLRSKFGFVVPLRFGASFAFEEMYGGVNGPSASLIQTLVTFSAIAGIPIRQDIAMTGAMDTKGNAEVIGGENEKIEGFYIALKNTIGFDEAHGVVIPRQNAQGLMLNEELVEDSRQGRFKVYAVNSIDEAVEIFTGMESGSPDENGHYPEGTFYHEVEKGLKRLAELSKDFYD